MGCRYVIIARRSLAGTGRGSEETASPVLGDDDDPTLWASYTAEHGAGWWCNDHVYQTYRAALDAKGTGGGEGTAQVVLRRAATLTEGSAIEVGRLGLSELYAALVAEKWTLPDTLQVGKYGHQIWSVKRRRGGERTCERTLRGCMQGSRTLQCRSMCRTGHIR